jgi:hypothetical protein
MPVDFIDDPDQWEQSLKDVDHDVFATYIWGRTSASVDGGRPVLAVVRDPKVICALPLIIRSVDRAFEDATSPYGYPGICFAEDIPCDRRLRALGELASGLADLGMVSCFVRENPLREQTGELRQGELVAHGQTVSIDLTSTPEARLSQLSSSHRYEVRRTSRAGVRIEVRSDRGSWSEFRAVYSATMARVQAATYYRWNDEHWSLLYELSLADMASLLIAQLDNRLLAGAMFLHHQQSGVVHYHLAAARRELDRIFPGKLLIVEASNIFADRSLQRLHLGGGVGGKSDSLFAFKAGFSPDRHRFSTRRMVLRPKEYASLSVGGSSSFFPAYRVPTGGLSRGCEA